jgi:DsbC/DsbD-like thiol-disulfide interchange protein
MSALCLLFFGLLPMQRPAAKPPAPPPPDGNSLVQVSLLSDRSQLIPGESFLLATRLKVTPRWHIYWGENPGDSGLATRVEVTTPEGFGQSPPRFPVPTRHVEPGDIATFQHEGDVYVLTQCSVPKDAKPGMNFEFGVESDWLVCIEQCYPGRGAARLSLPVIAPLGAQGSAQAGEFEKQRLTHLEEFRTARAQQPLVRSQRVGLAVTVLPDPNRGHHILELVAPRAQFTDFFPRSEEDAVFEGLSVDPSDASKARLRWRFKQPPTDETSMTFYGILTLKDEGGFEHIALHSRFEGSE